MIEMNIVAGGLALQGNPLSCTCSNLWLGVWLRRWMRETLQLHTSGVDRGQAIQGIVRSITCDGGEDGRAQGSRDVRSTEYTAKKSSCNFSFEAFSVPR